MDGLFLDFMDRRPIDSPALSLSNRHHRYFFRHDKIQWSLFRDALSWDGYALTLTTNKTKRSLHLISGASGALPQTLYRSQNYSNALFFYLSLPKQDYSVTAENSYLAAALCVLREYLYDFVAIPLQFVTSPVKSVAEKAARIFMWSVIGCVSPGTLLLEFSLMIATRRIMSRSQIPSNWSRKFSDYYPLSGAVQGIGLGALVAIPMLHGNVLISTVADRLIGQFGAQQEVVKWIMDPTVGRLMTAYACLGAPLIEERIFRGWLRDHSVASKEQSRLKTVIKTSVIFGLMHYSANQGLANVAAVGVTTFLGMLFALLTELTEDLWAATTAHALNNTYVTLRLRNVIQPMFGLP